MQEYRHLLEIAREAARRGAEAVAAGWDTGVEVHRKGEVDLVTRYDRASEEAVLSYLRNMRPQDGILAEEGGLVDGRSSLTWCVDPLDGTTNFAHGLPLFGVSVAALEDGIPVVGVVRVPAMGYEFAAARGHGAFRNGRPIRVSATSRLADALAVTGFPYSRWRQPERIGAYVGFFVSRVQGLRRLGAAALDLCFVACGWMDVFWEFELAAWDLAAGIVILEEAGGKVTDWEGRGPRHVLETGQVAASNGRLHPELLATLREMTASVDGRYDSGGTS